MRMSREMRPSKGCAVIIAIAMAFGTSGKSRTYRVGMLKRPRTSTSHLKSVKLRKVLENAAIPDMISTLDAVESTSESNN